MAGRSTCGRRRTTASCRKVFQAVPWPFPNQSPFHTGSISRDSLPLRQVHLAVTLPAGISGTDSSSGSFPHWQRFPRFAAVAAGPSRRNPPGRHLWYGFLIRFLSILAAFPAICCRCGKRSYLIVPNCRDGRPDLPNSVRIYTLCRYILSFCIVQHTVRAYCIYCQLFKIQRLAGLRVFCHKTAFKAHFDPCPADAFLQNILFTSTFSNRFCWTSS